VVIHSCVCTSSPNTFVLFIFFCRNSAKSPSVSDKCPHPPENSHDGWHNAPACDVAGCSAWQRPGPVPGHRQTYQRHQHPQPMTLTPAAMTDSCDVVAEVTGARAARPGTRMYPPLSDLGTPASAQPSTRRTLPPVHTSPSTAVPTIFHSSSAGVSSTFTFHPLDSDSNYPSRG